MQWILRHAGLPEAASPLAHAARAGLETPLRALAQRLAGLRPAWSISVDEEALSPPAEQAMARMLGWPHGPEWDGRLPWAARERRQRGLLVTPADRTAAWGCLTPAHGLVGSDRITLLPPPELQLSDEESKALYATIEPLYASEGVGLLWRSALAWDARHESLRELPCASLERVVGDSVQAWQARGGLGSARLMRRLQNEAQMVLHTHPVNESRAARGLLPVNTLWLSGCGALPDASHLNDTVDLCLDDTLHTGWEETHTRGDPAPWLKAWTAVTSGETPQRFDAAVAAWRAARSDSLDAGEPPTLVLCGARQAQAWTTDATAATEATTAATAAQAGWLGRLRRQAHGWLGGGTAPAHAPAADPLSALIDRLRAL